MLSSTNLCLFYFVCMLKNIITVCEKEHYRSMSSKLEQHEFSLFSEDEDRQI